jgi:hypothetical protein
MLPYTAEVYAALIGRYNAAMGAAGIGLAILSALAAAGFAIRPRPWSGRVVAALLAAGWVWCGGVFHYQFFAPYNFAAPIYAMAFVVQGVLLLWTGVLRGRLHFEWGRGPSSLIGAAILAVALVVDPVLGWFAGWPVAQTPVVGLTPDPTALLTLGVLALARPRPPVHLLILPVCWALWSGWMAWTLGAYSDLTLPLAGIASVLGLAAVWRRPRDVAGTAGPTR